MLCTHTRDPVGASEYQVLNKNSVFFFFLFAGTGTDVAGEVVEVGAEVKNFKNDDRVVAELGHLVRTYSFHFSDDDFFVLKPWICQH